MMKMRIFFPIVAAAALLFMGVLEKAGLSATVRRRMGQDIDGACGQLRQRYLEENENER